MSKNYTTKKSLTLKSIGLEIPVGGGDFLNKTVALVTGRVEGFVEKNTQYGQSFGLTGSFMVVNALTGEAFEGGTLYLPADFAANTINQLDKADGGVVLLGNDTPLEVVCAESDRAARGYTFMVRSASTPEVLQSRNDMASLLQSTLKALPAPEKDGKKAA